MRKFKESERIIVDDGGIRDRGHVMYVSGASCCVVLDAYPDEIFTVHWSALVHEPDDGTVPIEHRAKSSGALKGWR